MIPNVWDFEAEPGEAGRGTTPTFREDFGRPKDDVIFLQPTRIVARKGIENAIELVARYNRTPEGAGRGKLLVSHPGTGRGERLLQPHRGLRGPAGGSLLIRPDLLAPERGTRPGRGQGLQPLGRLRGLRLRDLSFHLRGLRERLPGGRLLSQAHPGEPVRDLRPGHRPDRLQGCLHRRVHHPGHRPAGGGDSVGSRDARGMGGAATSGWAGGSSPTRSCGSGFPTCS
ncbi:MAG: hypothetical protein M0C28_48605 [Candidatus Moduliflexus flocculans]|nr:hypothetical protein [Candidatus Moduliflexus flocculans]